MKRMWLLVLFVVAVAVGGVLYVQEQKEVWMVVGENMNLSLMLHVQDSELPVKLWRNEEDEIGLYYAFLPSFVNNNYVYFRLPNNVTIYIDGKKMPRRGRFAWESEKIYHLNIESAGRTNGYDVVFMGSEHIPAVYVSTESGSKDYILESKGNSESGELKIITANGSIEYKGGVAQISGRGNSTWTSYDKKAFSVCLDSPYPLCGMDSGKKWKLLALAREGTKMQTKLVMYLGKELGMRYTPQCVWVDLYLNGVYEGIYLLCESVSVGEGRVEIYDLEKENEILNQGMDFASLHFSEENIKGYDIEDGKDISGGYLLEQDDIYYDDKNSGFITERGVKFCLRGPDPASRNQVLWIRNYIQNIEDMLYSQPQDYEEYLDQDSFAKKFLLNEISLNYDAYVTSEYFYKDMNADLLYAGPLWDYDTSFGVMNFGRFVNYEGLIIDNLREESSEWYSILYEQEMFCDYVIKCYQKLLPVLHNVLENKFAEWKNWIGASVAMDEKRWNKTEGYYGCFENNVKYLEYFFASRLNYLNGRWNISDVGFERPSNGTFHSVVFVKDGVAIENRMVKDGTLIDNMPELDSQQYEGWFFSPGKRYGEQRYWSVFPVYEDVLLIAKEKEGT